MRPFKASGPGLRTAEGARKGSTKVLNGWRQ